MKDIEEYFSGHDPYDEFEDTDCYPEDDRVVIDYEAFVALAQAEAESKTRLNYILRALRLGVEPSVILAIFDEDTGYTIDELLLKPESPFYVAGNDEEPAE